MELNDGNGIVYIREEYIEGARPNLKGGTLIYMLSGRIIHVKEDIKDIKW
ncbi:hypothetical protein LCGC14_1978370 [marine sediment metagenome]|uniref:Uncharacterized protein n=1 Tax=marine sediment metagenome TaxID=412755 RepID=A0A0F9F9L3_9ZZZZ